MWKRLIKDHGLAEKRTKVIQILKHLCPNAAEERRAHRLKPRVHTLKGPNYVWHVDGYDKLKPFGFCIHGCIDGYSRRIICLEVAASNNDPAIVAKYYINCLKHFQLAPRILRADNGTENNSMSFLQPFFRSTSTDRMACVKSFMYGRRTANRRIEAWWGILRKLGVHWWINLFKDIRDSGMFNIQNPVIKKCLRFCFMDALQTDLDRIAKRWNSNNIRRQKRCTELPSGKPDVMYFVPELTDGCDFKTTVNPEDVNLCIDLYGKEKEVCSPEFKEIVYIIKPVVRIHVHPHETLRLFIEINDILEEYV